MHGPAQRVRLLGVAVVTIAGMALLTACGVGWRQPAPGPPPSTSPSAIPSAIGAAAQGQVFYAQAASYIGQDAWTRARQQAQALRAKGFPAAVYSSHTEFPSHTLFLFVAVASGQFPTVQQAKAQVERLRLSGFRDAKVFSIRLPK
jgi:cell division septation protein DedD